MRRLVSLLESSCDAGHDSAVLLGVVKPSVRDHVKEILSRATVFSGECIWDCDNELGARGSSDLFMQV